MQFNETLRCHLPCQMKFQFSIVLIPEETFRLNKHSIETHCWGPVSYVRLRHKIELVDLDLRFEQYIQSGSNKYNGHSNYPMAEGK